MEYRLSIREDTIPVEVEPAADNRLAVSIGDISHQVNYTIVNDHQIRIEIDGKAINAYLAGNAEDKWIVINGVSYRVGDADAAQMSGSRKTKTGQGPTEVTAPMPSVVVKIMAKEGEMVEKGQGLIVLSAMKMETTLSAPYSGTVMKINTSEGAKVMPGEILVNIEKDEEDD